MGTKLIGILAIACSCASSTDPSELSIDEYIRSLGTVNAPAPEVRVDEEFNNTAAGDYQCVSQAVSETRRYDRVVALSANSESLWPGAIVSGDSIEEGLFTQIPFDRTPLKFSVSLPSINGDKSVTMYTPSLSSYRDRISEILDQELEGDTPANLYAEIERVHSKKQLSLALGLDVEWLSTKVATSFDFAREDVKSRYVVKYTQSYFTVDADPPKNPSEYLAPNVSREEVRTKITNEPPLYVSSITHGRMVVFTFESTHSSKELEAALEFAYNGGVEISGDVSLTHQEVLSSANTTAYILGGSGEVAAKSFDDYDALMEFIKSGGNYSPESPGAPIAYKLSHLADNSPARFSLVEEYEEKQCERVRQKVRVTLENIKLIDGGSERDLELYGSIKAKGQGEVTLFSKSSSQHVSIREGSTWPSQGVISDLVVDVVPQPGEEIEFSFDLRDDDAFGSDVIAQDIAVAPFELGWRKQLLLPLTGSRAQLEVTISMQPI